MVVMHVRDLEQRVVSGSIDHVPLEPFIHKVETLGSLNRRRRSLNWQNVIKRQ